MNDIPRRFSGEISLISNARYRLSQNIKESVLECGLDFIPFALATRPDFDADVIVGSLFVFDESSFLYRVRYDGWELWRFFDKDSFAFIKGWLYRPMRKEENKVKHIWILNTCIDFEKV